jgi:hypothetical protein
MADDTPDPRPNWAFGLEQGIKCPECGSPVDGIDWITDDLHTTGMTLRPCRHQLTTPPWKLDHDQRGALKLRQDT